jgi:outer membrane lipoprotein-sorting protein
MNEAGRAAVVLRAALVLAAVVATVTARAHSAQDDLFARVQKAYGSLKSYADTGTVLYEGTGSTVLHHTFKTYFRAPRHLYFEFNEDKADGGSRLVLWGEGQDFQTWSSDGGVHNVYPKGQGRTAFVAATYPTNGVATLIPSLLFPNVGLVSTIAEMGDTTSAGSEAVAGRPAQKLTGIAQSTYGTGYVHNVRRVALWIDPDTLLVRKFFQDTPKGYGSGAPGSRLRITVTFEAQANPTLDDSKFKFTPPSLQK